MTKERITIVLPPDKIVRLRKIQSKVILETNKGYSMSKCIEDHLVLTRSKKVES